MVIMWGAGVIRIDNEEQREALLNEVRQKGYWNYIQAGMAVCPFCGASPHKDYKNFCPKCGADLRGNC